MDTLTRELANIGEQFIPKIPEMLLRLDCSTDGIPGKLGCLLTLHGDCATIYKGLVGSSIFTLEHHVELFPARTAINSLLSVDVKGF